MGKKWRYREGTLTADEEAEFMGKTWTPFSQDAEITAYFVKSEMKQ